MERVKIKLCGGMMPTKGSRFSAAYDLYVPCDVILQSGRQKIDLQFCMELPHGYAAVIQPRSGFSTKGLECMCTMCEWMGEPSSVGPFRLDADVLVGLVDEDFRGSVGVTLDVHRPIMSLYEKFVLERGARIAQMRIVSVPDTEFVEVDDLDMTNDRGGGFGHTGVK